MSIDDSGLLHAIFTAAEDAMIVADATGTIQRVNDAACAIFQFRPSEFVGQNVRNLMPEDMAVQHDGFMHRYLSTGERRIIGIGRQVEGQRKDGSAFPLHLSVGHAEVSGIPVFVAIMHDLTPQKVTQDALARSQRLDAIGQMTGGITHDFNNLLTVIIGNLELLQMRIDDDKQQALIADALEAAEMGADLTERMLVFARRSNLRPVQTDLAALCEQTLALLRRTLGAQYHITTDFAPDLSPVMVDPVQLQSALVNLALNARDAMGGQGELLISLQNVRIDDTYMAQETDIAEGDYVRLSVSDNGAGMDAAAQKRAFEPFFTTKADKGGSGLGLAMVYGFVRQSGGHITLYSEVGLGSSFGLYFPALRDGMQYDPPEDTAQTGDTQSKLGAGLTVLIVEDNPKVRRLSVQRIADLGFRTREAASGDEAYAMLKAGTPVDIVFSDLVMPGQLNGYDLAAKIAAEFPAVRVLLTSGYSSDVVTASIPHERSYHILHKPYRQTDLAQRLYALVAAPSGETS